MRAKFAARALMGLLVVLIRFVPAQAAVAPLRVSYPVPTATQLPLWVAKEAKFFDKHGVAVDLVYVQKVWPQIPDIQPEDLTAVLEQQAETNPKALEINPAELIYDGLMENVVRSGFVKQVYR
jgi:hypothetical protein